MGIVNDEDDNRKELLVYGELATWDRFKQEIRILESYGVRQEQIQECINKIYKEGHI